MSDMRFPVGEYIADELEARGWTTRDCAERMGGDVDVNQCALELAIAVMSAPPGHAAHQVLLGEEMAKGLERAMGISAESWLRLDEAYRRQPESN